MIFFELTDRRIIDLIEDRVVISRKIYWFESEYLLSDKRKDFTFIFDDIEYPEYIVGVGN
ncbi:hypothetical protein ACFSX9_12285 [Flavobacterium ardleyense]|uniref:Uncharacterized protein n=1 Tax=Flavobacterium ardleyense TaxID=2038737 RepID=A0ABW5Z9H0_9FLAO